MSENEEYAAKILFSKEEQALWLTNLAALRGGLFLGESVSENEEYAAKILFSDEEQALWLTNLAALRGGVFLGKSMSENEEYAAKILFSDEEQALWLTNLAALHAMAHGSLMQHQTIVSGQNTQSMPALHTNSAALALSQDCEFCRERQEEVQEEEKHEGITSIVGFPLLPILLSFISDYSFQMGFLDFLPGPEGGFFSTLCFADLSLSSSPPK